MDKSNSTQEVLKFLQDLDSLTAKKSTNPSPSKDLKAKTKAMEFLDEITSSASHLNVSNSQSRTEPKTVENSTVQPVKQQEAQQSVVQSTLISNPLKQTENRSISGLNDGQSAEQPVKNSIQNSAAAVAATVTTTATGATGATAVRESSTLNDTNAVNATLDEPQWTWTNLWSSTTQQLSKGISNARALAQETAKVVSEHEDVQKMIKAKPDLGKLSSEFTKLATKITDTIAPPIHYEERKTLHQKVCIWLLLETDSNDALHSLKDVVQMTANQVWLHPDAKLCNKVTVNSVQHPQPTVSTTMDEAIAKLEENVTRLQKLSDEQSPTDNSLPLSVLCIIQQIEMKVPSLLLDDPTQLCYFVAIVCDSESLGVLSCSSISQSVNVPIGIIKQNDAWAEWFQQQKYRILETAIGDLMEEFMAKVSHARNANSL